MTIPTATIFDLADWNPRALLAADGSALTTNTTSGLLFNANVKSGHVSASAKGATLLSLGGVTPGGRALLGIEEISVPDILTLEFSANLAVVIEGVRAAPKSNAADNFASLSIASVNRQQISLKLTDAGIFVCKSELDTGGLLVPNSAALVSSGTDFTVRVIVDFELSVLTLYAGATTNVYVQGSGDWWASPNLDKLLTMSLPQDGKPAKSPGIYFEVRTAGEGADCVLEVTSLRMSSAKVPPRDKPVAVITAVDFEVVGATINVFGSRSHDQNSLPLTYEWDMLAKPAGAIVKTTGAEKATATITCQDGPALTLRFKEPSTVGNDWSVALSAPAGNSEIVLTINTRLKRIGVVAQADEFGNVLTTAETLHAAISMRGTSGFNEDVSELVYSEIIDDFDLYTPLDKGTFRFSGGALSTHDNFVLSVSAPGPYLLGLRVFNGVMYSDPVMKTVVVQLSDQAVGRVPATGFIFDYIRDFWDVVPDKEVIETFWDGAVRCVAADLSELWQVDLCKSIKDIPRTFQKKWLSYSGTLTSDDFSSQKVVIVDEIQPIRAVPSQSSPLVPLTDELVVEQSERFTVGARVLVYSSIGAPVSAVVLAGTDTGIILDSACVPVLTRAAVSNVLLSNGGGVFSPANALASAKVGEKLVITDPTTSVEYLSTLTAVAVDGDTRSVTVSGGPPVIDGILFPSQLAIVNTLSIIAPQTYIEVVSNKSGKFCVGDVAEVQLEDPISLSTVTVMVPVLAFDGSNLFIDWSVVSDGMLAAARLTSAVEANLPPWELSPRLVSLRSSSVLVGIEDLVSVPTLAPTPDGARMQEGIDYSVGTDGIVLFDRVYGEASATAGDDTVLFINKSLFSPGWSKHNLADDTTSARVLVVTEGLNAGTYQLARFNGRRAALVKPLQFSGDVRFRIPAFDYAMPPAETLWAEISHFSNDKAVNNNFGILAGVTRDEYTASAIRTPYIDVVRGTWMGLINGPQISNIAAAVDVIAGMPYTREAGVIVEIREPILPEDIGIIRVLGNDGDARTYRFPFGIAVGANPVTNRPFKAVAADTPVESRGEDWEDAQVGVFTPLVSMSSVEDYISDELFSDKYYDSLLEYKKFHAFVVRIPVSRLGTTQAFSLIRAAIDKAKPAYTHVIVLGYVEITENTATTAVMRSRFTSHLYDSGYSSNMSGGSEEVADGLTTVQVVATGCYPTEETLNRHGDDWGSADVDERFESGYCSGVMDNYSGDGAYNASRHVVDMANRFDSDVDTTNSLLWVPILKSADNIEFVVGEFLVLMSNSVAVADHTWASSKPILAYVGCGTHPKIPFSVYSPQLQHPHTYLVLKFSEPDPATGICIADIARLNGLARLAGTITLVGATSGAEATVTYLPDLDEADDARYFRVAHILANDVALDMSPETVLRTLVSTYIPAGGITYEDLRARNDMFDADHRYKFQQQVSPYYAGMAADISSGKVNVPAPARGMFVWPDNKVVSDLFVYDYAFSGSVWDTPVDQFDFLAADQDPVENLHLGVLTNSERREHFSHGNDEGSNIPTPVVTGVFVTSTSARVEGHYFTDDDPTRSTVPSSTTYDGDLGGSWVFFRPTGSAVEYAAYSVVFETGKAAEGTRSVNGIDGSIRSSTGRVLIAAIPLEAGSGDFDVVVRNYRKYKLTAASEIALHYEEFIYSNALSVSASIFPNNSSGVGGSIAGSESAGG